MNPDDDLIRRLNAELEAWEQRPDAARWRPTPPPPQVDMAQLMAAAEASLEAARVAFQRMAAAVVPVVQALQELEQAQTERARPAVPFWTEQPNRTRRRR